MPKVLVAGEKAFFIHSFENDELNSMEITRTRNDSAYAIGHALDDKDMTTETLEAIRPDVIMMLKQSETWKKAHHNKDMDGFSLLVFRGKTQNGRKSYIGRWCGQSNADMLSQNPQALIGQLVKGFKQLFNPRDYHKKSVLHTLLEP